MRDQVYRRDQIPAYGGAAQPALAERMQPVLRRAQIGIVAAVLGVLLALAAVLTYADFDGGFAGRAWTVTAFIASVLLLVICVVQYLSWQRAMAVWQGRAATDLSQVSRQSFGAHIASYVVVAIAFVFSIASIVTASWLATSSILLVVSLLFLIAAQLLAGVQYVRDSGPPGALPAHMHKAIESQGRRRG